MSEPRRLGPLAAPLGNLAAIIPLQRTLVRRVLQVFASIMLLWFGVWLGLNDARLGHLVSYAVMTNVRGQFQLGYAHYDYWSSLGSLILNTPAPVSGGNFKLIDPNGQTVVEVPRIEATMYIGELVRGLIRTAVSAPFGRGSFIELHFSAARLDGAVADIHPIVAAVPPWYKAPPGQVGPPTEMNIVATMSGKKWKPEDAPPSPGHVRILLDGQGLVFSNVTYRMAGAGWHGHIAGMRGSATLRYNSDAAESRPGLLSFVHEVSPVYGETGELVLGTPEGAGEFVFPLERIELRRFGARPSRRQDLVFRGQLKARGAQVELDGKLLDTYCDTGVQLDLSFEQGGGLAELVPGQLLRGEPRGRVRFYGPLSSYPPVTPSGKPAPCLKEPGYVRQFPTDPDERAVDIAGQVADVAADVATVQVAGAKTRFRMWQGVLKMDKVEGEALGGRVVVEPLRFDLRGSMPWLARITVAGSDPSQAGLVPVFMRPYLTGKMRGALRISGNLAKNANPSRILIEKIDATLDRAGREDPLPRDLKIAGTLIYTPKELGLRGLSVHDTRDTFALEIERGSVGPTSGKLDMPAIDLRGKGPALDRVLAALGADGAHIEEASTRLRLGGKIANPLVDKASLHAKGIDVHGRRFDALETEWGFKDGVAEIAGLDARGGDTVISADGSYQLFGKDLSVRPADPRIAVSAAVQKLSLDALPAKWAQRLRGALDAKLDLHGTLHRPTGTVALSLPELGMLDGKMRGVSGLIRFASDTIALSDLTARFGGGPGGKEGVLTGGATLRRDGEQLLDMQLSPSGVPLRELPGIAGLPVRVDGILSGGLRIIGATRPLAPSLEGELHLKDFVIRAKALPPPSALGTPDAAAGAGTTAGASELEELDAPLLGPLAGIVLRALRLPQSDLVFHREPGGGTRVSGKLFGVFNASGTFYVDGERPRGDLTVRFGCPIGASSGRLSFGHEAASGAVPRPQAAASANPGTNTGASPTPESGSCDLAVFDLIPELRALGDLRVGTSGELHVRFGDDPRGLFGAGELQARAPCEQLAGRPPTELLGVPFGATLRLGRARLDGREISDEGDELGYRLQNDGDVLLCTDGSTLEVGQANFFGMRVRAGAAPEPAGDLRLRGVVSAAHTDLNIVGKLRLVLLEHWLRATFRRLEGDALVNLRIVGPRPSPGSAKGEKGEKADKASEGPADYEITGSADLMTARLLPHDIDTPIDIRSGHLQLTPGRAALSDLRLEVDGAVTTAQGSVEIRRYSSLELGHLDVRLQGDMSARLLQWRFARNLAEARGSFGLSNLHVTGTFTDPIVEGTLAAKDLLLNLRRFHEIQFTRGTVRLVKLPVRDRDKDDKRPDRVPGRIFIGCSPGETAPCQPLAGLVDGDGHVTMNGRVDHSGLGDFIRPDWYQALDDVRASFFLENVRHAAAGVYNVEVSSPSLLLSGNREQMRVSGGVEVVSGRYMQDFDLADRFLSARRVVEEEAPFWEGDPFLSGLLLNLSVRTRGTFRVFNNIADLRLSSTGLVVKGPLDAVRMGGVIRVESGIFFVPGLRSEFQVKGDSTIEFSDIARWPETPWVELRGSAREFDQNDQQRIIELALRGRVKELKVECLSSEGMSATDCASYLVLGDLGDTLRGGRSSVTPQGQGAAGGRALEYSDPAAKLLSSQLLTNQVADPLRQKLRLDTVRIQFGVSTFDLQLCKRFGLYVRMCGLAEWGLLGNAAARYRGFGELQLSDLTVGQVSLERIERGFSFLEDTINRFKVQAGLRLPLRY